MLRSSPLDFLLLISGLIETVAPPSAPSPDDAAFTLARFVASFEAFPCTETTAALRLVAAFSQDEDLRTHIGSTLAARRQPLPPWLAHLDDACVDGDVLLVTDPLGDSSGYTFAVRMAGGVRFTVVVGVDHTVADAVREAMVVINSPEAVAATSCEAIRLASAIGGEPVVTHLDPGDARAVIEYAISQGDRVDPPFESPTWPANRALVEWAVGLLPPGGAVPVPPSWSDDDLHQIADTFFASTDGADFPSWVFGRFLDLALRFAVTSRATDPLRWTPLTTKALLDWALWSRLIDHDDAELLADLLITWVPYTCRLRGVDPLIIDQVRDAVEQLADELVDLVDEVMTSEEEEWDEPEDHLCARDS
ncbi:hypothetical protein SAMN05216410_0298 [Sanguibacter gelidistatuariae]|uniref:Uncharacterized protein n=1 Tax=Sanguibacter gelidistatuariae TaxID=1814289 RepID=A0A1G6GPX3_9MICO|nr:hypothetical protein [Sanguibacter gelidistatuariae]SDB83256.1 hypothetical protein SAMN05216410_0298 [Sanguibacter gelidistatuariae]